MLVYFICVTRSIIFWCLLVVAITLTSARFCLMQLSDYQQAIAQLLTQQLNATVSIEQLSARLQGLTPQVRLTNIKVAATTGTQPAIFIKELRFSIGWRALFNQAHWLEQVQLRLVGAKFALQQTQGQWGIVGLASTQSSSPQWLFQAQNYQLLESDITLLSDKLTLTTTVNATVKNSDNHHKLNALIKTQQGGDTLQLVSDITGDWFAGNAQGQVYLKAQQQQLGAWTPLFLPNTALALKAITGQLDTQLWLTLHNFKLEALSAELTMQHAQLLQANQNSLTIEHLHSQFAYRASAANWELDFAKLSLKLGKQLSFQGALQVKHTDAQTQLSSAIATAKLADIATVAQFFLPADNKSRAWLQQAQLRGALTTTTALATLEADYQLRQYALQTTFKDLSFAASTFLPLGISHLNGQISASEQGGMLQLASEQAHLDAPQLFPQGLHFAKIAGKLHWQPWTQGWALSSEQLQLNFQGLHTHSRLRFTLPKNAAPFLDLQMAVSSDDVSQLAQHFPSKVMHPDDVSWLSRALVGGKISQGKLMYYGRLSDYPFKDATGVFEAQLQVEQGILQYAPDWPTVRDIRAEVLFLNDKLAVNGQAGQSAGLRVNQVLVINPQLGKSKNLSIAGNVGGSLSQVLAFLKQTPLQARIASLSQAISPHGDTQVNFDIILPLTAGNATPKVSGFATLHQASLLINALDLRVSDIDGRLQFNEHGVFSQLIKATAFAEPIRVTIDNLASETAIKVTGRVGTAQLQQQFPLPLWAVASGTSDYQLNLQLPRNAQPPKLTINSQLQGLRVQLPDSLAKTAQQASTLTAEFTLNGAAILPIQLSYAGQLHAKIDLDVHTQQIWGGHLVIGSGALNLTSQEGLRITINRPTLDLHDWLASALASSSPASSQANPIKSISIHSKNANFQHTPLGQFSLNLQKQNTQWLGSVNSQIATGIMTMPTDSHDPQGIVLTMDSLDLSALKQLSALSQSSATQHLPTNMPLITLSSQQTFWQRHPLGKLTLSTQRTASGISLRSLTLNDTDNQLSLTGAWQQNGNHDHSQLQGQLHSHDIGKLLRRLSINKDLSESEATLDFMLHWHKAPQAFSWKALQGSAHLKLTAGRILNIEPGLGRVLGILAMAQWGKRLQLDFSDLYTQGLSFDSISGQFSITEGIASSNNLIIDAIPAKITLTGKTNLGNKTLDQLIDIAPKSADAVPIAGTLLGEITGIVTQTLTGNKQESFFFGSQYRAVGTWKDIQIIPLHENDGLVQKTWSELSRFPWLTPRKRLTH